MTLECKPFQEAETESQPAEIDIDSLLKPIDQTPAIKYRPDIDGLRAIAVLVTIGFHAFPAWAKGGFIGVDVFFVISGFLISSIIFSGLKAGTFSFIDFYSRRIRRIFPALTVVLFGSLAFGWFALLSDEYKQLGKHVAGGAGYVSNYILWGESGYFDNIAETKPLLHLWSLGIEEQFYILWPLLLWLAWKKRFNLLSIAVTICVASFAMNIDKIRSDAIATFYSPQTRFWELLAGAILAYVMLYKSDWVKKRIGERSYDKSANQIGAAISNALSVAGFAVLTAGLLVITKENPFPSWWAVLPVVGTTLIIAAGSNAWLNRVILSNRILVWLGLISYPLYLWHWPLLSFARIVTSETPSITVRTSAVILSVALAWATHRLIESPLRYGQSTNAKTVALFIAMIVIGYAGYKIYQSDGLPFRDGAQPHVINEGDTEHDIFLKHPYEKFHLCTPMDIQKEALVWKGSVRCFQSEKSTPKKIALIGDSHAEHLFIGLAEHLKGTNIVFYIKGGAMPYMSDKAFEKIYRYVINDKDIETVIIATHWKGKLAVFPDLNMLKAELGKTVAALSSANKKVYLAEDVPTFSFSPLKCKYSRIVSGGNKCEEDRNFFYSDHNKYLPILESIRNSHKNTEILKMADLFCDTKTCNMSKDGQLLYRDENHLSINGSLYLGRKMIEGGRLVRLNF